MVVHTTGSPQKPELVPARMLVGSSCPGMPNSTKTHSRRASYAEVHLADAVRLTAMLTPASRGTLEEQLCEVLEQLSEILRRNGAKVTIQSVFLRSPTAQAVCEQRFAAYFGPLLPIINYVMQAPACGAAVALEVWAIHGDDVEVERPGTNLLTVAYDSVRWIYCADLRSPVPQDVYGATRGLLGRMGNTLENAGASLQDVVRTWFYLGGITEPDGDSQRYKELNRARSDHYQGVHFGHGLNSRGPQVTYPASTGIGMDGTDLLVSCVALQSNRQDILLTPLENPLQTPAYAYKEHYSPQSPKFSRAMALRLGEYITTWVSGTASIVRSESCHHNDIENQTRQTIENIAQLIGTKNMGAHGLSHVSSGLQDLAKIRVYIKRPADYAACRSVCERVLGDVPAIYAIADVCRPELLVEIEGVAFSKCDRKISM